jgi:hypothetical protein
VREPGWASLAQIIQSLVTNVKPYIFMGGITFTYIGDLWGRREKMLLPKPDDRLASGSNLGHYSLLGGWIKD